MRVLFLVQHRANSYAVIELGVECSGSHGLLRRGLHSARCWCVDVGVADELLQHAGGNSEEL